MFSKVSWSTGTNNRSQSASGFGPYYGYGVGMDVVAMASIGATARAVKLAQVGRSVWVNCEGSESGSTGFSATWGCWKNTIVNLKADNNASQGLWFSGCADSYNTVIGVQARGNGTSDISILATANNNTILGYAGPSATVYDDGTNNVIGHAEERWRAATLLNSWANYGGFYREAGYMRDAVGTVHLRGCIKSGSTGTTAFTLPDEPGWRPVANVLRLPAQGVSAYVEIEGSSRNVNVYASDTTFISLDGISFRP
jgi:hypothetical protein